MSQENKRVVLASRPPPGPIQPDTFKVDSATVPELSEGEVAVRVEYVSVDPTMRGWINDVKSYLPPVAVGAVMRAYAVGQVTASRADALKEGQWVGGLLGWQEVWVGPAARVEPLQVPEGAEPLDFLGYLGTSGLTAYFGLMDIGKPKDGETVVVSGAAGSVGLIVTQLAAAQKCRVVAIAGSADKLAHLKELGADVVLNYKDEAFKRQLHDVGGIDVFFDNVGGEVLDRVLAQLNDHARIVLCGAISVYNSPNPYRLLNTPALISTKSSMTGFIVMEYAARYAEGRARLAQLRKDGQLEYKYHVVRGGVGGCVNALQDMFAGKNEGKTVVHINDRASSKL
ncbi:hypothetical protein Q5752_004863 [Cryptotrichosporon argae]